jgi:tripartite-type tricarboxylate transporter receptor subunit TctC
VLFAPDDLSRPLFAPPGVPAERVKVLRDGFMNLMNDRDVLTDARKKGLDPNPVTGAELESLAKALLAQPPEVIQRMKKILEK